MISFVGRTVTRRQIAVNVTIGQRYASSYAHVKRVGVIGAGVAGLQAARSLKARGFEVEVFDKAPEVGGLWRENYVSSGIQIRKNYYGMLDTDVPFGDWASTPEIKNYIKGFVDQHGLQPLLRLNTAVDAIKPRADGQRGWDLEIKGADGKGSTCTVDFAVVSHGLYSQHPNMPSLPGKEAFGGKVLHSSEFLAEDLVKGKRVVVVGGGKSAMDIAKVASKEQALLNSTLISELCLGRWIWKSLKTKSGGAVPWNIQTANSDPGNLLWEKDKTFITCVTPGLYEVTLGFFSRRKPVVKLHVNGESVLTVAASPQSVVHHAGGRLQSSGRYTNSNITGLTHIDFVALPARARVSISYQGDDDAEAFMGMRKL